jgi:hypothetical protein
MSSSAASQGHDVILLLTMLSQLQQYIYTVGTATRADILADNRL